MFRFDSLINVSMKQIVNADSPPLMPQLDQEKFDRAARIKSHHAHISDAQAHEVAKQSCAALLSHFNFTGVFSGKEPFSLILQTLMHKHCKCWAK